MLSYKDIEDTKERVKVKILPVGSGNFQLALISRK
jgi:hypothetical protein